MDSRWSVWLLQEDLKEAGEGRGQSSQEHPKGRQRSFESLALSPSVCFASTGLSPLAPSSELARKLFPVSLLLTLLESSVGTVVVLGPR